jgi:hypothetical protein
MIYGGFGIEHSRGQRHIEPNTATCTPKTAMTAIVHITDSEVQTKRFISETGPQGPQRRRVSCRSIVHMKTLLPHSWERQEVRPPPRCHQYDWASFRGKSAHTYPAGARHT